MTLLLADLLDAFLPLAVDFCSHKKSDETIKCECGSLNERVQVMSEGIQNHKCSAGFHRNVAEKAVVERF